MSNVLKMLSRGGAAAAETDPNFKQTVLLLHGDGTNGAQNNTFLDGSTNNFTITRNGNTTQGTFSPFSLAAGEWSNYFDGTGDYFEIPDNIALRPETSNFTIEAWVYRAVADVAHTIFAKGSPTGPTGFFFTITTTNTLQFTDVSTNINSTGTIPVGVWTHVAVVREGTGTNQLKLYINGVQDGQGTVSTNFNQTNVARIGANRASASFFNGYISNFRFVKGTAVYTSAFTPPTAPLTAISNTSLLTCQSNRFVDNSTNNFTLNRFGDVRVTPFSPFAPSAAYSAGTNGGSGYFDGTGDYLTITSGVTNQFDPGSAFTFECWFYQSSGTSNLCFEVRGTLNSFDASNGILFRVWPNSSGSTFFQFNTAGAATSISTTAPPYNTWVHLAVGYNGTTTRFWVNGVSAGTSTASYTKPTYDRVTIGNSFANVNPFFGYLSNMRFVKGSDVYGVSNTTITVPTSPVTAITNTSLLLNFTNAGIIDNTGKNVLETVDNAQIDTTTKKYGTGSLEFDGSGDYLNIPHDELLNLSGVFTFECWFYLNTTAGTQTIASKWVSGTTAWLCNFTASSISFLLVQSGNADTVTGSWTAAINQWYHLAVSRDSSNNCRMFLDGVQIGSTVNSTRTASSTSPVAIGFNNSGVQAQPINGYIDDLRITKGVARYTANFTPPTKEFPDQ